MSMRILYKKLKTQNSKVKTTIKN